MSDNEDLLGDDLGDQSLADYNLGNEEEEQLLADDYESGPQNVPTSVGLYREPMDMVPPEYPTHVMEYNNQPLPYQAMVEECVVPNITVEVPNTVLERPTYAPYEPQPYEQEHAVPPAIPAAPVESPQIVPSDINPPASNGDMGGPRERFVSERPPGAQRMPQIRDIPDSLDKVVVPGGGGGGGPAARGRTSWRNPQRYPHPYRRNNMHRGNFNQRSSFPPPQIRHNPPQMRPGFRPEFRPEMYPDNRPEMRPEIRMEHHQMGPELRLAPPQMGPEISPERPILPQDIPMFRPQMERPPFPPNYRFHYRPEERFRPNFDPRPVFFRPTIPRQFAPMREIAPNTSHLPQVTIRQALPMPMDKMTKVGGSREPEVRMLPVALPPTLPPGGLAGKKVLINPHFKGNFQPPVEGLPAYIPTRIHRSPPVSPTLESKFGPVKDIDDAAERFIAEQRNALARAAVRKYARRSPQRYIENTTIEIENDLAAAPGRRRSDDELSRRQEEFISANRAGLRRRMRSPSPAARRSASPRRSPERRPPAPAPAAAPAPGPARADPPRHTTEETEYKRRLREQESLRERVLRAKEVRRRKNAVALHKQLLDKERDAQDRDKIQPKPAAIRPEPAAADKPTSTSTSTSISTGAAPDTKPDTTRSSPDKPDTGGAVKMEKMVKMEKVVKMEVRDRSPVKKEEPVEVNSTCEALTPPPAAASPSPSPSPERALTPPLPARTDSDDDLDLILGDIDGILSDDEDSGRFKDKNKVEASAAPPQRDLRSKLPPRAAAAAAAAAAADRKPQRQKIVFQDDKRKKDKSPLAPRRTGPVVTSSTKTDETENIDKKPVKLAVKTKHKTDAASMRSRPRITFDNKQAETEEDKKPTSFSNRRVILQRKTNQPKDKSVFSRIEVKTDPTKPNPGIFSRAVRTAIGTENSRIVIKKEPEIEFESDSDIDEDKLLEDVGNIASVGNLPHGMTDTRLKTLAGSDVQNITLDKEERSAKITFKNTNAAETFKKKFNNKMVAASRLTVTLR